MIWLRWLLLAGASVVVFQGTPAAHACTTTRCSERPTAATAPATFLVGDPSRQSAHGLGALPLADEWTPEDSVVTTGLSVIAALGAGGLALNERQRRAVQRQLALDALADVLATTEAHLVTTGGRECAPTATVREVLTALNRLENASVARKSGGARAADARTPEERNDGSVESLRVFTLDILTGKHPSSDNATDRLRRLAENVRAGLT